MHKFALAALAAITIIFGGPAPANAEPAGRFLENVANGRCITSPNGANNTRLTAPVCTYDDWTQRWAIDYLAPNTYRIHVGADHGKCLVVPYWADYDVVQYSCGYDADQLFSIAYRDGAMQFRNQANGLCLAAPWWAPNDMVATRCDWLDGQYYADQWFFEQL